jgi:hypothetical protein
MAMTTFCFTFGCGSPLARYYVEIDAEDEDQARCRMFALFSRHWASVYPRDGFDRQIAQYGYQRLDINKQAELRIGTIFEDIPLEIYNQAFPW